MIIKYILATLFITGVFVLLEKIATCKPNYMFSKWWRKHIVGEDMD